jgi:ABC-type bacteriocin/lantibiotic exporter with double-glycine peptidase domain
MHHAHVDPIRRVLQLVRTEGRDLWVVLTYAAGIGLVSLAVPIAVASLVNTVAFGTVLQQVFVLTFFVLVGLSFEGVMASMQFLVVELLQRRVFVRVALDLAHRLPRVRSDAHDSNDIPELVNRFFDVVTVQKTAASLLLEGLALVLQAVIGTLLLAFYHPALLAFDAVLVLGILLILFPLGRGAIPTSIEESKGKYAVAAWLEELGRNPQTFRPEAARAYAVERTEGLTRRYLTARALHFRIVMRQQIGSRALKAILSAALLGLGGWLVSERSLSVGQLAAAELIVSAVVTGVAKFSKQLDAWYDLVTAVDKLGHLVDLPTDRGDGAPLPGPAADRRPLGLEFVDVEYRYEDDPPTVQGVQLRVAPGARVAVVGVSSAGKSTLAALAVGLRAPTRGVVRVDGADMRELSLDAMHRDTALIHRPEVFNGSVYDNVAVGRADVSADDVRSALRSAGLEAAVAALGEGVHTRLQVGGRPFSSAQSWRLMFARAIARRPRLLVIDGALDGLDDEIVDEVLPALLDRRAPWTLLLFTHRTELARRCDVTFDLHDGAVPSAPFHTADR